MQHRPWLLGSNAEVPDAAAFAQVCFALASDVRAHPEEWETTDLADFLEKVGDYAVTSLAAFYGNVRGEAVPDPPTWLVFADLLRAARVYE